MVEVLHCIKRSHNIQIVFEFPCPFLQDITFSDRNPITSVNIENIPIVALIYTITEVINQNDALKPKRSTS